MTDLFAAAFGVLALILLANWLAVLDNSRYTRAFDHFLLIINLLLLLNGIMLWLLPPQSALFLPAFGGEPAASYLIVWFGMSLWGIFISLAWGRRWLARWMPLRVTSPVHTLALFLSGLLAGSTLLSLTQGGLEGIAETAVSAPLSDFVLQQLLFILAALLGIGLAIRRRPADLMARLGLKRPSKSQIRYGLRWIAILLAVQWIAGIAWAIANPEQSELLGGINNTLLGNFDTVGEWIVVALGAGLGEEILFRGALQPVLGLWFTSILFAIAHIQYGFTPITLLIFIISIALGHVRRRTNTTVAIFVHAGYDFVLGLLFLLAVYLEPFAK